MALVSRTRVRAIDRCESGLDFLLHSFLSISTCCLESSDFFAPFWEEKGDSQKGRENKEKTVENDQKSKLRKRLVLQAFKY